MKTHRPEFTPSPVTLTSELVTLRPLSMEDVDGFYKAGNYEQLWRWVVPNRCTSREQSMLWIEESLRELEKRQHVPFVIIHNESNEIIGSTRYCSIEHAHRSIEIGYTFITPKFQRSKVNTQCKFLLLQHAFEQLGAIRVQLRTHENNTQSRNAIARIGAKFEGIIRNARILSDGTIRNTALFSITEQEWPSAKTALKDKLEMSYA